jgi:hypothetical protein
MWLKKILLNKVEKTSKKMSKQNILKFAYNLPLSFNGTFFINYFNEFEINIKLSFLNNHSKFLRKTFLWSY